MADIAVTPLADAITTGQSTVQKQNPFNQPSPVNITPTGAAGQTVEVKVQVERTITYFKRGFFPVSGLFQYWQTEDPEGANPSGDPLIDITILSTSDGS